MPGRTAAASGLTRRDVALLLYGALHSAAGWLFFCWIMWRVVPAHASMLEGARIAVPGVTRAVIGMSHWFVRLLPFVVMLVGTGVLVVVGVLAALMGGRRVAPRKLVDAMTVALLFLALAGTSAVGFSVWALNHPIQEAIRRLDQEPAAP